MVDFCKVDSMFKKGVLTIYPEFKVARRSKDLMIRGKSFYAVWDESAGFWSKNEADVQRIIDQNILEERDKQARDGSPISCQLLQNFSTNKWTEWQKYVKSLPDNYVELDKKLMFSNQGVQKEDYVTRKLSYPLLEQETPAYDELMSVIYSPEERQKLEWAVGAIITGDAKYLQKFIVLYGAPGTGKSTFLNIIQGMFPGYYSLFNAKNLTGNADFALESLKNNPLFAVQHDGDLSRIEDNTLLNSIVSHEEMEVNEKYKNKYTMRFETFLFMGTNKPVKITDSKSGILRRLIDVNPTGNTVSKSRFEKLWKQIKFEYSGIAWHCKDVFENLGPNYYDHYVPVSMIGETNDLFNFIEDNYDLFLEEDDGVSLSVLWKRYKAYCEEANVKYILSMRAFKIEMKEYFESFSERDGHRYSVYRGFRKDKFYGKEPLEEGVQNLEEPIEDNWLKFNATVSEFDDIFRDCPAQYANRNGIPNTPWDSVKTTLKDLDTRKLHYVRVPEYLIVVDFDLKNENGEKCYDKNVKAALEWPQTYAEVSRSGGGIHLHYYYRGDISALSRCAGPDIEIKVHTGKATLRRQLTKCNDLPIATISSGLPMKPERSKMLSEKTIKSEKSLRDLIQRNLRKEIHPRTKPSMDFIQHILQEAYDNGMRYDVSDMRPSIQNFAMNSTNNAEYCMRLVSKLKFKSEEEIENDVQKPEAPIVFFDVEVFLNLFVVVMKRQGPGNSKITLVNPSPTDVEKMFEFRLVGFNNRRYDNHIIYARSMGYTNEQLYNLSQRIISGDKAAFFGEAYNLSYTDIYDFLSSQNKKSLKKWEIQLGIHHMELGLPWDKPVPEHLWPKVAEYCGYDVDATEATWDANQDDWLAREILADISGLTPNDTTNSCTTRIIIGNDRDPWSKFVYTDLSTIFPGYEYNPYGIEESRYNPGVKIVNGKSIYKGEDPGEGGYVYAEPGIYYNVALLDIASMHPNSIIQLNLFGDVYTMRFAELVNARLAIKHKDYDTALKLLDGLLSKYVKLIQSGKYTAKQVANALKTAINSVYGLTSAGFQNKLRDPRNVDNIVAKRGALFMIDLKHAVQEKGYTVVQIKTDSIKIANADQEIIDFVMEYGKKYGYTFEHEDTYEKICLVNDAVYIAKYKEAHKDEKTGKDIWWTATGTQFQIPYVFKTLFSHEPITFGDLCETKSVSSAIYLDFNEQKDPEGLGFVGEEFHDYRFVGKVGAFCPMKDGVGGGILLRDAGNGKYNAVAGTKKKDGHGVYRWMESEMVQKLGLEDQIDRSYYNQLVDEAVETIGKYGDSTQFMANDSEPDWMKVPETDKEEIPFPMNEPVAA